MGERLLSTSEMSGELSFISDQVAYTCTCTSILYNVHVHV